MQTPRLSRRWQVWLLWLGVLALVFAVFAPALRNGFVGYDDPDYVTGNRYVQQGVTWKGVRWAFTSFDAANWHPLTWLSHQLDAQLFGLRPWGHHLTSIGLHALNAALLFGLLRELTGATWRSLVVALLFGLHPLRVESVAWISERKDVLSGLFFLLTCRVWAVGREAEVESRSSKRRRLVGALVLYAMGLMSKPMLVTLPFVLLLLDYWPLGRLSAGKAGVSFRAALLEKAPFFALAIASGVVTVLAQGRGGAIVEEAPLPARAANALVSYARYLGKLFWPADLSPFYPPVAHWPALAIAGSALLLAGVTALVFTARRRFPWLLVGWLWFVGMLVPVIGLLQAGEQSMADRYSYLPSIGLLIALAWMPGEPRYRRLALGAAAAAACLLVPLASLTRTQIACWHDTETLFTHALRLDPANYLALNNLGAAADRERRTEDAVAFFTRALDAKPGYAHAHNNLGAVLLKTNRVDDAIAQFRLALQSSPAYADAHNNLGAALELQGRSEEALRHFAEAARLNPAHADARYNLGLQLIRQGRFAEAIPHLEAAIRLQPASADAHNNLGFALQQLKQHGAAVAAYRRAIALRPDYPRAHFNLGVALFETGQLDAAIASFKTALKLKPDYVEAQKNLKALLDLKR